jgi:hypothetical protein
MLSIVNSLEHQKKINHKIITSFSVFQPNPNMIHDIRIMLMDDYQIIEWLLDCVTGGTTYIRRPKNYLHITDQVSSGVFEDQISRNVHAYFVLDNSYSAFTVKQVQFIVREEWDENDDFIVNQPKEISPNPLTFNISNGEMQSKHYDVFICHATEDKDTIARPFAERLRELGLEVWYDEFSLGWGNSLRSAIDEGLQNSSYGIVILSKVFSQKTWTKLELDGMVTTMTTIGKDRILPLRYKITPEDVAKFSPMLAGIFSRSWDEGIEKLSKEVEKIVEKRNKKLGK